MGLFKNLRQQVKAAADMAADIRASTPQSSGTPLMGLGTGPTGSAMRILNPTPQIDVDRLIAAGGVARGVVVGARHDMEDGSRSMRTRVHVRVRSRLAGGALGDEVALTAWVGWRVAVLLEPGLEIPIELDRATGRPTEIAVDELRRELEPRSNEAAKRQRGWDMETGLEGVTHLPGTIKDAFTTPLATMPDDGGMAADDPLLMPIEGVALEQLISVQARLAAGGVMPADYDAVAQEHGVPAGRWVDIERAWYQRIFTSPPLSHRWGTALERSKGSLGQ